MAIAPDSTLLQSLQTEAPRWGYYLDTATDLTSARQQLLAQIPDAIILDLDFPDPQNTGLTFLTQIKRLGSTPVLILTQQDTLSERITVARLGAYVYLQKPAFVAKCLCRVASVLGVHSSANIFWVSLYTLC